MEIAEVVRDQAFAPYRKMKAEKERIVRERQEREQEERGRKMAETIRLSSGKRNLVDSGLTYADKELNLERDLSPVDRWQIREAVQRKLAEELKGDETKDVVLDLVDEILDTALA